MRNSRVGAESKRVKRMIRRRDGWPERQERLACNRSNFDTSLRTGLRAILAFNRSYWKARKAELWIESPYEVRVTSFADLPNSLCRDSTTVDAETEMVDVGSGTDEDDYRQSVQGENCPDIG
jgi:hypothetical protein